MKDWQWNRYQEVKRESWKKWEKWFAWYPVKTMSGTWVWREVVYRKCGNNYVDQDDWKWYFYAETIDLLKYS